MQHTVEPGGIDIGTLIEAVRNHDADVDAARAAAEALVADQILDRLADLDDNGQVLERIVDALESAIIQAADPLIRENAVIALAAIDDDRATAACYRMFDRHRAADGVAGRLLAYFTGDTQPTVETLVAGLPECDNFDGVLTQRAIAEYGAAAVAYLHAALLAFPVPAQQNTGHWMADEITKCRIMSSLRGIGPVAASTTSTLIALLLDDESYRDTRHQAKQTLIRIGSPETVEMLIAKVRSHEQELSALVHALAEMPPESLAAVDEVDALVVELSVSADEGYRNTAEFIARKVGEVR
ncbi:hypothetical protein [Nocardia sp. NPDC052566]|uniref:hypothetical protein n=1 Tax=Nocardia sp. NPDC052566 TaxID=3364330 RepID=UPI0037CAFECD